MTSLARILLATMIGVTMVPALASAQDDAFRKGMQARGDKKWDEAARQMRAAIQADSQESKRKVRTSGVAFFGGSDEYLPYYYLGEALMNLEDCAGAVGAWGSSLDQNVVQSKSEFVQVIQQGFKACAAKGVLLPGEYDQQLKLSRQAYVDASAMAKRITDLGASHRDQWLPLASQYDDPHRELDTASARLTAAMRTRSASDFAEVRAASERAKNKLRPLENALNAAIENLASVQQKIKDVEQAIVGADALDQSIDAEQLTLTDRLAATRKAGREQLTQARTQLATAQKTQAAAAVTEAFKSAQTAVGAFNQVLEQVRRQKRSVLDQQLSAAVRVADEAFLSVSALMETMNRRAAQRPDAVTPEVTSQRDAIQKRIDAQRSRYERARKAEDLGGLADVTKQTLDAQASLNALIETFGPLTLRDRGVHAALEDGARLFFQGDYERALTALDPSTGVADSSLPLHVHLFRAASLYGLFVRSGETRQDLRERALEEIALCKQISSTFEPDARFFAPRFISLYKTGETAESQAASR